MTDSNDLPEYAVTKQWLSHHLDRIERPIWYFLDERREPPQDDTKNWVIFRTGEAMVAEIMRAGYPQGISLDHDFGSDRMSGSDVIRFLIAARDLGGPPVPFFSLQYEVHSQNPSDRDRIASLMNVLVDMTTISSK